MIYIKNAVLDSVLGAGFAREDLSRVIMLRTMKPRPISQNMPQVPCSNEIHQWRELGIGRAGTGVSSYAEGALPNTVSVAPVPEQNNTCRIGFTAQVTDEMAAVWTNGGEWDLADGDVTKRVIDALDLQVGGGTMLILDEIEFMHAYGNSANPQGTGVFPGGQTTGLLTWALAYGVVVTTGGTTAAPVNFLEAHVIAGMRGVTEGYPLATPNKLLITSELRADFDSFVGGNAGRTLVQQVGSGPDGTAGLVAGQGVSFYRASGVTLPLEVEPYFSSQSNQYLPANSSFVVGYNDQLVKQANLIKLSTQPIAKTDTSVKKMVNCTFAQEHWNPKHVFVIPYVKSAITTAAVSGTA